LASHSPMTALIARHQLDPVRIDLGAIFPRRRCDRPRPPVRATPATARLRISSGGPCDPDPARHVQLRLAHWEVPPDRAGEFSLSATVSNWEHPGHPLTWVFSFRRSDFARSKPGFPSLSGKSPETDALRPQPERH